MSNMNRRELLGTLGKAAALTITLPPILRDSVADAYGATAPLNAIAGPDRFVVLPGKTYLNAWAGYGEPPRPRRRNEPPAPPPPTGPAPTLTWSKESGPGSVQFADAHALVTTATFSEPGSYVLKLTAHTDESETSSSFHVAVEQPRPLQRIEPVRTRPYRINSRLWNQKAKSLIVNWIPHCIDQLNATDLQIGSGGIDNFVEAAKALRGEAHGPHKGYVFSNAYVHNCVEAMCIALMVDPQGDQDIAAAQDRMRQTLEDWIPRILAAQEPDGYLQTAFTLRDPARWAQRWTAQGRGNHEGYTAGYFIEAGIAHHVLTKGRDTRLYDAARKLADCWDAHIGPPPKQEWFDGHQEMEQALVRLGRYVNEQEGRGRGDRYTKLGKFLLDCRQGGSEYDQSHLPVTQQYEAVGHAVRAAYNYAAMADVAFETRDVDYQSAVRSIWDNIVNRKYYVTGGIGSGETSEGFGPNYSLRNNAYCESCSSCGEIYFQSSLNRLHGDARYADLYEETVYNALLGSTDIQGEHFYYTNPLDANATRTTWHNVPCCTGNIPRTLLALPTLMYGRDASGIYVNLFVGSTVTVDQVAGTTVELEQQTDYPWDGKVTITVNPQVSKRFSLRIRVPNRDTSVLYRSTPAVNGLRGLALNGTAVKPVMQNGYAVITRAWKRGDKVQFEVPMVVQRVHADEKLTADRGKVALRYGPLMYAIEQDDQDITQALPANAPLSTAWRDDLLGGVQVIKGAFANGAALTAIPYYLRYNRSTANQPPPPRPAAGERPTLRPPTAVVWIQEV